MSQPLITGCSTPCFSSRSRWTRLSSPDLRIRRPSCCSCCRTSTEAAIFSAGVAMRFPYCAATTCTSARRKWNVAGYHKSVAYEPSRVDYAVRLHVCAVVASQVNAAVHRDSAGADADPIRNAIAADYEHGAGRVGQHLLERHAAVGLAAEDAGHAGVGAGATHLTQLFDDELHPRVLAEAAPDHSFIELRAPDVGTVCAGRIFGHGNDAGATARRGRGRRSERERQGFLRHCGIHVELVTLGPGAP